MFSDFLIFSELSLCYPIADGRMELSRIYLQRGWIIQHKANSWCGFVVTVTSESLDCTAMTLLPYGSISPGRGNGKKLAFFHFFGAPLLWPNGSTRTGARAVWSLGDNGATNHHHHHPKLQTDLAQVLDELEGNQKKENHLHTISKIMGTSVHVHIVLHI